MCTVYVNYISIKQVFKKNFLVPFHMVQIVFNIHILLKNEGDIF